MKHIALLFFMLVMAAHAEEATETSGKLMNVADFVGNKWASVCAYGTYPNQSGVCISDNYQSPQCPTIEFNGTVYGTHAINTNVSSFSYHAASGNCYGPYHEYTYNPEIIRPVESGGDFLYAASFSGALCPYGEYHLNGTCYPLNETSQFGCDAGSHMTVTSDASFMGPKKEKPRCNGDYDLYNFVSGTNSPSYLDSRIYPLYNGTLLVWGGAVYVVKDMTKTHCTVNPDEYYNIDLLNTTSQPFAFPILGMCDDGHSKFIVEKNCHYIKSDADIAENMICGVLCENPNYVYTNSGVCSERGYCSNDGKHRRLYVGMPNGDSYSYPLYASKTTEPALNFRLPNDNGGYQTCYVNLVPPDAIKHFVMEKPNPLRLGYPRTWTMGDGKEYSSKTLITID